MTNQELFEQYNTEKWVIEQNLCFLLQLYWDRHCQDAFHSGMPENPVTFVKKFMKEETICDVEYAEKSKMSTLESREVGIIGGGYTEVS
jgi:hypothetical protein